LPTPFDARTLCATVAAKRGRPILLSPMASQDDIWGLWVATDTSDLIFYDQGTTPPHQQHIILHELSHVLCDHYRVSFSAGDSRRLLPDLDPEMVRRILGRTTYSAVEEQEAELLASLIRQHAGLAAGSRRTGNAPGGGLVEHIQATLDWSRTGFHDRKP
jgi:hypothetical protein